MLEQWPLGAVCVLISNVQTVHERGRGTYHTSDSRSEHHYGELELTKTKDEGMECGEGYSAGVSG